VQIERIIRAVHSGRSLRLCQEVEQDLERIGRTYGQVVAAKQSDERLRVAAQHGTVSREMLDTDELVAPFHVKRRAPETQPPGSPRGRQRTRDLSGRHDRPTERFT
jgi:hypothetical protein